MKTIVGACCLMLLNVALTGCGDKSPSGQIDAYYERADSPEAQNALQAGWIPAWVPHDALRLHEVHDFDSKESLLLFEQSPQGSLSVPMRCDVVTFAQTTAARLTRPWWPSAEVFRSPQVMFYRCPPDADGVRLYIAMASGDFRVYVWRAVELR